MMKLLTNVVPKSAAFLEHLSLTQVNALEMWHLDNLSVDRFQCHPNVLIVATIEAISASYCLLQF